MNDRFKFRVWDKINEIWVKNFSIDEQGYVEGFYNPPQAMNRRLVLMQCTGLKDKNGKLIYEGDIVKETVVDYIDEEFLTVVCWSNLKASYNIDDTIHCEREVIGNIYENKELLDERD